MRRRKGQLGRAVARRQFVGWALQLYCDGPPNPPYQPLLDYTITSDLNGSLLRHHFLAPSIAKWAPKLPRPPSSGVCRSAGGLY